jgi:hypothetical protein
MSLPEEGRVGLVRKRETGDRARPVPRFRVAYSCVVTALTSV